MKKRQQGKAARARGRQDVAAGKEDERHDVHAEPEQHAERFRIVDARAQRLNGGELLEHMSRPARWIPIGKKVPVSMILNSLSAPSAKRPRSVRPA